jgi:hypothetical protein
MQDIGLSLLAIPLFITAAIMGMYRNGQLGGARDVDSDAE